MDKGRIAAFRSKTLPLQDIVLICQHTEQLLLSRSKGKEVIEALRQVYVLSIVRSSFGVPKSLQAAIGEAIRISQHLPAMQVLLGLLYARTCFEPKPLSDHQKGISLSNFDGNSQKLNISLPLHLWRGYEDDWGCPLEVLLPTLMDNIHFLPTVLAIQMRMVKDSSKSNSGMPQLMAAIEERILHLLTATPLIAEAPKYSRGLFSSLLKKEPVAALELDGTTARDCFTILNISPYYSNEQLGNIISFGSLSVWLQTNFVNDSPQNIKHKMKISSRLFKAIVAYCERVWEQTKKKSPDAGEARRMKNFTELSLIESICIVDILCKIDPLLVPDIFPKMKQIFNRNSVRSNYMLCLALLEFFINHCEREKYNPEPLFRTFFEQHLSQKVPDNSLTFEVFNFCIDFKEKILRNTNVFQIYFPPLLKAFCWHPYSFAEEIYQLIPAMMNMNTFLELFHLLLDLPLVVSAMEQMSAKIANWQNSNEVNQSTNAGNINVGSSTTSINEFELAENTLSPEQRVIFNYLLRNESGVSINFWQSESTLPLLQNFCAQSEITPRIRGVCYHVPKLLKQYFEVISLHGGRRSLRELLPVMFERMGQLFPYLSFQKDVRDVMVAQVTSTFSRLPSLVISMKNQIEKVIVDSSNEGKEELILVLCWAIGECLSCYSTSSIKSNTDEKGDDLSASGAAIQKDMNGSGVKLFIGDNDIAMEYMQALELVLCETISLLRIKYLEMNKTNVLSNPSSGTTSSLRSLESHSKQSLGDGGVRQDTDLRRKETDESNEDLRNTDTGNIETVVKEKEEGSYNTRLLLIIASSLTKLAATFPAWSQKADLLLIKILHSETYVADLVIQRARELRGLLQVPSIAAAVLNRQDESRRFLQGISKTHVDRSSSLLFILQPSCPDPKKLPQAKPLHDFSLA